MSFHLRMIIIKASALSAFEEAEAFFKVSKTIYKIAIVNLSHTIQSAKPTKKSMREAYQPFAYCRPAIRILQVGNSHTFNFSPHCFFTPSRRYCRADFIEYYTSKIQKQAISILRTFSKSILHQHNALISENRSALHV